MCKNGDTCHEPAPRGSSTGTQGLENAEERGRIPEMLCNEIVGLCEGKFKKKQMNMEKWFPIKKVMK